MAYNGDQVIMCREGRAWVYRRVIAELHRGSAEPAQGAQLALHIGDIELWDHQGNGLNESPGWQDFYDSFLAWLPRSQPGRPGIFFPTMDNHETWGDEEITGLLSTLPYLQSVGLSRQRHIYAIDFNGCRFIFLDSGGYKGSQEGWYSDSPGFAQRRCSRPSAAGCRTPWNSACATSLWSTTSPAFACQGVAQPLAAGDLGLARQRLGMIVGRDTAALDEQGVARALIETMAENLNDGVVAPLCYLALGGAPLGVAYKAVNTLDSMVGYRNERYQDLGLAAARLGDVCGCLPARLTALLMAAACPLL